MCAKWERMWSRGDNQEVGLEAAILERVRNSSLVKWFCADNVAGLKRTAEAVATTQDAGARNWMSVCCWVAWRELLVDCVGVRMQA